MGKKTTVAAPAPDPMVGAAAATQAQLGVDWLEESKRQFGIADARQTANDATTERLVQRQLDVTDRVTNDQLATSATSRQWAAEDRDRDLKTFRPMQDRFIADANAWDSPERQAMVAAEAQADVRNAAASGRATAVRQAAAMGIAPTSGRFAGVDRAGEAATAVAAAGAANTARNQVRQQGMALRGEAINLGSGLGVNPGSSLGLSVQGGSAAVGANAAGMGGAIGAQQATAAAQRANLGILGSGYSTAMNGYGTQANILGNQQGQQISAWSAAQQRSGQATAGLFGGLGSLAGTAAGLYQASSKDAKENKQPVEGALDALMGMPVEKWDYKPGHGDGGTHVGPYAEDFTRETGQGDGKSIDLISAIGLNMKATQELAKEVRAMKRGRGLPARQAA